MSQIDQAFIQAYTAEDTYSPPSPDTLSIAAEPIPAPHFRMHGNSDHYADTAAMQRALRTQVSSDPSMEPTSERRPLSTFVDSEPAATTSFQPVFEVDAFRWPEKVCQLLQSHADLLTTVVQQLLLASEEGRSMVGISGVHPGVGCSTVQVCLARLLADAGKTVAMVDGNFTSASLGRSLGLEFETGWEDVLSGRVPLAESVVQSIEDGIALLPLSGAHESPSDLLASIQTSVSAGVLRYHYDIVLFDLGSPDHGQQSAAMESIFEHCRIDASIIVADTSTDDAAAGQQVDRLMSLFGSTCLGLIGNCPTT